MNRRTWRSAALCGLGILLASTMTTGADRPAPRREVVPDRTILLLQQDLNTITGGAPDAVVYGNAKDAELLRQIAVATRASAQAQLELLRQQNEIIRLLDQLQRGREVTR